MERLAGQQILHGDLKVRAPFPDQLPHQAVAAGVGPVWRETVLVQIIDDGPGIVDI